MRWSVLLVLLALISTSGASAKLERGIKAGGVEDIVLVGAEDWHSTIAATPLAIWTEENGTVVKPLINLPAKVAAGNRMGWVEQSYLDRYGEIPVLHTLTSANISSLIIHGSGERVKALVEAAQKEGVKAYITATLEPPTVEQMQAADLEAVIRNQTDPANAVRALFFGQLGLTKGDFVAEISEENLQRPGQDWPQVGPDFQARGDLFCPVNPEVREGLYNRIEEIIDDYKADGVVLYNFGFQSDSYCFCDVCKEKFYRDTGIDLTKASSGYNLERWKRWREEQVLEIVKQAKNITTDLGPVGFGVALESPLDRSHGYNYAEIANYSDFVITASLPLSDVELASRISETPVYPRLRDDYVEYTISTQNVEGSVRYLEDAVRKGAAGFAFDYDVVYTPLWAELEPPLPSARWLLDRLPGRTLGVGNVSWDCSSRIKANNSYDLASQISRRWASSPGAVIVGENYSQGLLGASLASYLNWPVLFAGTDLPPETASALSRLGSDEVVTFGISSQAKKGLEELNLTVTEGSLEFILKTMGELGESPHYVVMTNSRDLSLLQPKAKNEIKRTKVGGLLVNTEISPSQIPSDRLGEIVRLNITLTNILDQDIKDLVLVDLFPAGRYISWFKANKGSVNITDPISKTGITPETAFFRGSFLLWKIDQLEPDRSATVNLEVELLHPLDAGWKQPLDSGITVTHSDLSQNVTAAKASSWPITNISYPKEMPVGIAKIFWEVEKDAAYTGINVRSPEGWTGVVEITNCTPGKVYNASLPMPRPGRWIFNIYAGDGFYHVTENYTIDVRSTVPPVNFTAFSHTKVPKLSLVSAPLAAARKAVIVDLALDPQEVDPAKAEETLNDRIKDLNIDPQYLVVVGDPGTLPFVPTGLSQNLSSIMSYDLYREYKIDKDDDNYTDTARGRILGLSVYDASQLVARTLAYDQISGDWRDNAMVISTPVEWPWNPIPLRIRDYLIEAGLKAQSLRWEEATYQRVSSMMNNGQNIVHFDHHGLENAWSLNYWSMMDGTMDETEVKDLTLAPQTTTANSCLTSRLKGFTLTVSGTKMYIPLRLEDSIALAFLRSGAVNYVGSGALSWIFISDDHPKRVYQALVYENATIGEALVRADNLYLMKMKRAEGIDLKKIEETLPPWSVSLQEMYNQTVQEYTLFGDPAFRPNLPLTPKLPYAMSATNVSGTQDKAKDEVVISITPTREMGTDWLYWIAVETTEGSLHLNAPPVIIGEVKLPKDADDVVVKENGRAVWHQEDLHKDSKTVSWPVLRPRLNDSRNFTVEYQLIPGQVQSINISGGWNMISMYLDPKDPSITRQLEDKPYRGIFTVSGDGWNYTLKDDGVNNVTVWEPGRGYMLDSTKSFTLEIPGKPVELPYRVKLQKGWNMIGLPFNHTLTVGNITVNAEHKRYTYAQAVEKGVISAFLWSYQGEGVWGYLGEKDTMEPGISYLIEADQDCRLEFR